MLVNILGEPPEGLDRSETARLGNYAARLGEHAAAALASRVALLYSTTEQQHAYRAGLARVATCAPEDVKEFGVSMVMAVVELALPPARSRLVTALTKFYVELNPLPPDLANNPSLSEKLYQWAAMSDMHAFMECFINRVVPPNDTRDILMCLETSLRLNGLLKAFNKAEIVSVPREESHIGAPMIDISFLSPPEVTRRTARQDWYI